MAQFVHDRGRFAVMDDHFVAAVLAFASGGAAGGCRRLDPVVEHLAAGGVETGVPDVREVVVEAAGADRGEHLAAAPVVRVERVADQAVLVVRVGASVSVVVRAVAARGRYRRVFHVGVKTDAVGIGPVGEAVSAVVPAVGAGVVGHALTRRRVDPVARVDVQGDAGPAVGVRRSGDASDAPAVGELIGQTARVRGSRGEGPSHGADPGMGRCLALLPVEFEEDVLVPGVGAHFREVDVDPVVRVDAVVPVDLPVVLQAVSVGVGIRRAAGLVGVPDAVGVDVEAVEDLVAGGR